MFKQLSTTIFFCLLACSVSAAEQKTLADEADRINYTIGHQIGSDFKRQKVESDGESLRLGLKHGEERTKPLLDSDEMQDMLIELKRNITTKMRTESLKKINARKRDEEQKRSDGEAFLQKNQTLEGVKVMPGGLQYKVIKAGKGKKPKIDDYVIFNYRAKTLNGKEYDSSFKKGRPAKYLSNGVLPGFTEAIQMMQPGAKWELYLSPELAYGRHGPLAHQTIILEVELLSIGHSDQK